MNQRDYLNDILYDRKKLSMALAVIAAAVLIIAFLVFGGQSTPEDDQQEQQVNTENTQQQDESENTGTTPNNTTQTTQPSGATGSSDSQENQETTEPEIYEGTASVSYTAQGFVPETIMVRAGTTLYFTNNSGRAMRIGSVSESNSTQAYAFFQQPSTISTGDSYMFVFNDPGTLFYHNLNHRTYTGAVIVVE